MRRITKAALGGLAGFALVLGGTQVASGSDVIKRIFDDQQLTDMLPAEPLPDADPADTAFDGARATLRIMETPDGTGFKLRVEGILVEGIHASVAGRQFGSHLHVGSCAAPSALDPNPTGGHYQDIENGPVTPENEVWFNVVPNANGVATHDTYVSFKPVDRLRKGAMSIVIHAGPTGGPKEVCLPLAVGEFW